jgi:hypothetical protein
VGSKERKSSSGDFSIHQHCRNRCLHAQYRALDDSRPHTRRNCQTGSLTPRLHVTGVVRRVAGILEGVSTACYPVVDEWATTVGKDELVANNVTECSDDESGPGAVEIALEERQKYTARRLSRVM